MAPAVRFSGITKRFPGVVALGTFRSKSRRELSRGLRRERRRQEHARQAARRHRSSGRGHDRTGRPRGAIRQPGRGARRRRGDGAPGARVLRQPLGGREPLPRAAAVALDDRRSRRDARARAELLAEIGAEIDPARPMSSLSVAEQQLVQIAAAVGSGARVIVFDEPTSSLSEGEAARLYDLVSRLTARGVTLLYVSHRMPEIFRLSDRLTVLRDGEHVATRATSGLDERELVQLMIGRRLETVLSGAPHGIAGRGAAARGATCPVPREVRGDFVHAARRRSTRVRRPGRRRALGDCEGTLWVGTRRNGRCARAWRTGEDPVRARRDAVGYRTRARGSQAGGTRARDERDRERNAAAARTLSSSQIVDQARGEARGRASTSTGCA